MIRYLKKVWRDFLDSKISTKIAVAVFLLVYIFVICVSTIKVDVEVYTPGVVNNTNSSVDVKVENKKQDLIGTIGIYTYKPVSLIQYWIANGNDKMVVKEYDPENDLNAKGEYQFGVISKKVGINYALINAYEAAYEYEVALGKASDIHIDKTYRGRIVSAILPYAKTDLNCDDIITHINGVEITEKSNVYAEEYLKAQKESKSIVFTVIRTTDGKDVSKEVTAEFVEKDGSRVLGVSTYEYYVVDGEKSNPKFSITDQYNSIGSSGSAMLTLAIFNDLIENDITKGKFIVGTGSISVNGQIEKIDGVEQKVLTANLYQADIFFVDDQVYEGEKTDYELALEACKKHGINSDFIIRVSSFSDIIAYLKGLEG